MKCSICNLEKELYQGKRCRDCRNAKEVERRQDPEVKKKISESGKKLYQKHKEENKNEKYIQNPNIIKKCSKCNIQKPETEFDKLSGNRKGVRAECKKCAQQKRRLKNKEKKAELTMKKIFELIESSKFVLPVKEEIEEEIEIVEEEIDPVNLAFFNFITEFHNKYVLLNNIVIEREKIIDLYKKIKGGKRKEHIIDNLIEKKYCGKCQVFLPLDSFKKRNCDNKNVKNKSWDNLQRMCKVCTNEYRKKGRKERKQKWAINELKYSDNYKKSGRRSEVDKIWYNKNKDEAIKKRVNYQRDRKKNDPYFAETVRARSRFTSIMKKICKNPSDNHFYDYLGCTGIEYCKYMENKFVEGMSWDRRQEIHFDHIIPISAWNLKDDKECRACWHYTNLQPLWAEDNLKKSNKYKKEDKDKYFDNFLKNYYTIKV